MPLPFHIPSTLKQVGFLLHMLMGGAQAIEEGARLHAPHFIGICTIKLDTQ
jgi:hypothetical protein